MPLEMDQSIIAAFLTIAGYKPGKPEHKRNNQQRGQGKPLIEEKHGNGKAAAQNGVDFSQLFSGLSFFILVAGIVLIMLLFLLNMESRQEQLKTLTFLGISLKKVRMVVLYEVLIVAFVGTINGTGLAYVYCLSVFSALNGVWNWKSFCGVIVFGQTAILPRRLAKWMKKL